MNELSMTTMQKHAFIEDISFETTRHVFLVNFMTIGTYKHNIVHVYHINMYAYHNST